MVVELVVALVVEWVEEQVDMKVLYLARRLVGHLAD